MKEKVAKIDWSFKKKKATKRNRMYHQMIVTLTIRIKLFLVELLLLALLITDTSYSEKQSTFFYSKFFSIALSVLKKTMNFKKSFDDLQHYVNVAQHKGYDPYDVLNSPIPFQKLGKWIPVLAIQFQKRNPINIRPLLGIHKEYNAKAVGLFLFTYCQLQKENPSINYFPSIRFLFNWLKNNKSPGYNNACWGYNFDWASRVKYLKANEPNIVVTSFVARGVGAYYHLTKDADALQLMESSCCFITQDLPITETADGICFSYTPVMKECCYNASLLGAEVLIKMYSINRKQEYLTLAKRAIDFVLSKQHADGHWNYSINTLTGKEREQIDFHQGYVIDSIQEYIYYSGDADEKYVNAVKKGLEYYKKEQFFENGQSKWRVPKIYPVEIHNQSQGIITFIKAKKHHPEYGNFANQIAEWTITNMQDKQKGFFYYRKNKFYTNKIPYMRWSQAWMLNALAQLISSNKNG